MLRCHALGRKGVLCHDGSSLSCVLDYGVYFALESESGNILDAVEQKHGNQDNIYEPPHPRILLSMEFIMQAWRSLQDET